LYFATDKQIEGIYMKRNFITFITNMIAIIIIIICGGIIYSAKDFSFLWLLAPLLIANIISAIHYLKKYTEEKSLD